jgi:hypothetical protein
MQGMTELASGAPGPGGRDNQVAVMRGGEWVWVDPPRAPVDVLRDEVNELRARVARLEENQTHGSNVAP